LFIPTLACTKPPNKQSLFKYSITSRHYFFNKICKSIETTEDWVNLNLKQILTSRHLNFKNISEDNYEIGNNLLCNRLASLNDEIILAWLALAIESFKIKI
jgi:hypothetical protein